MNKIEYLSALKEALKNTDESVMQEIISDYEEHFQVGLENGKSEEQICEDLGTIDDLVEDIKEVYNTDGKEDSKQNNNQTNTNEKKTKEWHFNIPNIDSEKIGNAINSALDSAGEAISKIDVVELGHTLKSTLGHATSTINNFADNYLKNQGAGPFDFNKRNAEGYTENVTKSYDAAEEQGETGKKNVSYEAEPIVEASESSQTETEDTSCGIETGNDEKSSEEAEAASSVKNSEEAEAVSSIKNSEEAEATSSIKNSEEAEAVSSVKNSEEAEATSSVKNSEEAEAISSEKIYEEPEAAFEESEPDNSNQTSNGLNLVIDGICAFVTVQKSPDNKININYVNNGNERQKQMYEFYSYREGNTVYAGIRRVGKSVFLFNLKLNTIMINIELPDNMSSVNIKTASGDIKINNVNADRLIATTASGDVLINRAYTTDLRIKCSSGDISLEDINSVQLSASTMSGDVKASNVNAKFQSLKSSSGDVKARNLIADIIDNSSLSGDIDIVNMKTNECKIRSTSGDIDINEFTMINADISSISGDIKLPKIIGDGLRVSSTSGDVILAVNVKRCHASSKSGNVEVKSEGDLVLEAGSTSGNVNIILKNYGNGYSIKSRTTSGELYINYNNMRQRNLRSGTYTFGNQGSELIISSVSGDIRLTD